MRYAGHSHCALRNNRQSWSAAALAVVLAMSLVVATPYTASAAQAPVPLGTADAYAVLAGSTVTNTGPTLLTGDLGLSPGTSVTGFPPGSVNGTTHVADANAIQAKSDLTIAYNDAAGRTPVTTVPTELGGTTLVPGVYTSAAGTLGITGNLTLNGQDDPNAVFIFKTASTLITASASTITLINGAQACNVYWQVGSSATLGTASGFVGNILALTSITATTGAKVDGRLLARNGAVTLDSNDVARSVCSIPPDRTTATTVVSSSPSVTVGTPITFTATVVATAGFTPTGTVIFTSDGTPIGSGTLDATGRARIPTTLPLGAHQIVATYQGSPTLNGSPSPPITQLVRVGPLVPTGTTVTSSNPSSTSGTPVTLTARVVANSGATPTGTVAFTANGVPLGTATLNANGNAAITTSALPVGQHQIVANYQGSPTLASSISAPFTQSVVPRPTPTPTPTPTSTSTSTPTPTPTAPSAQADKLLKAKVEARNREWHRQQQKQLLAVEAVHAIVGVFKEDRHHHARHKHWSSHHRGRHHAQGHRAPAGKHLKKRALIAVTG